VGLGPHPHHTPVSRGERGGIVVGLGHRCVEGDHRKKGVPLEPVLTGGIGDSAMVSGLSGNSTKPLNILNMYDASKFRMDNGPYHWSTQQQFHHHLV
jgi:hypothetical protein